MYYSNNEESTLCQCSGFQEEKKNKTNKGKETKTKPTKQTTRHHQKAPTHKTLKSVGYYTGFELEPVLNNFLKYSKT